MSLLESIKKFKPLNQQEACDKERMIAYMAKNDTAHFTASMWTVNRERTKTLMVYHNIYNSWSWIGGHADGEEDLRSVAMGELKEETGVKNAVLLSPEIFSLEILTVDGHVRKGIYVPRRRFLCAVRKKCIVCFWRLPRQTTGFWRYI